MSAPFLFWKMSGAGNDFVVADARGALDLDGAALARRLCPRRVSVGADGLLLVRALEADVARIEYRNSDGSPAEFCGNGARCVARFVRDAGIIDAPRFRLRFAGALVEARVEEGSASVLLPLPECPARLRPLPATISGEIELWEVRAGVPHLLTVSRGAVEEELDRAEALLRERAPELLQDFNVTAVRVAGEGVLEVATLERGSARTLACGSAAVAGAAWAAEREGGRRWQVIPPSGSPLFVTLSDEGALLEGEARLVYRGELEP